MADDRHHTLDDPSSARQLMMLVEQVTREMRQSRSATVNVDLDSNLDRDLGFDSLARAELIQRTEKAFEVQLPERLLNQMETPADLLRALRVASPGAGRSPPPPVPAIQHDQVCSSPVTAQTLQQVLQWHVQNHGDRPYLYLYESRHQMIEITYRGLQQQAQEMALGLIHHQLSPGDRVAIMLPTCGDYFYVFFAILLARGVPVPIYPPARLTQLEDHLCRHSAILNNARVSLLVTIPEARGISRLLQLQVASLHHVLTPQQLKSPPGALEVGEAHTKDIAFLQYTSGSTGNPKGVILTHHNLLSNIRAMGQAVDASSRDIFVSWLPVYHDMGLIGACFGSLYHAIPLVLMSPQQFLTRPEQWLWAIHHHRGTISAAPNFAYELCLNKIEEQHLQGLDLSCWRLAWNGAEPVSATTIEKFSQRFAPYGFKPTAMSPVYGLAECSVGLTFPPLDRRPVIDSIQRQPLEIYGQALPATKESAAKGSKVKAAIMENVALGHPLAQHQLRVVDHRGRELPERREGEIEFSGPSATRGYFEEEQKTLALFRDGWLKTGDRGYLVHGELYITGRVKDIIIRAGRNIYPHELEESISRIEGVRKGCVAAFAIPRSGTEQLIILAESHLTTTSEHRALRQHINQLAQDLLGTPPDDIIIARPHTVPKTSSGKIRRSSCRELYLTDQLDAGQRAVWLQIVRLTWAGVKPQWGRGCKALSDLLHAAYLWFIMAVLTPVVWLSVAIIPHPGWCWQLARSAGRLLAWLSRTPITVDGLNNLPVGRPAIYVANHASYLDGLLAMTALPRQYRFVAKRELTTNFFARVFLSRIGTEFVDRFDARQGVRDARRINRIAKAQCSLFYFPEGTLQRTPGLRKFHMGAFMTAVEAQLPVVPITIVGSRSKLRGDSLFPRPGPVHITISTTLEPPGSDWQAAVNLRDAARKQILCHCKEPDLSRASFF